MSRCRACGEAIDWLKTASGRNIPVDPDTVTKGDAIFDRQQHTTHFDTCRASVKKTVDETIKPNYQDPTYIR